MKGMEIAEKYFNEFGLSLLDEFKDIKKYLAVGLCGSGSECFGYDDEISTDHDFEPGFIVFLPSEDIIDRKQEFLLERAYSKLPKEYMGLKRNILSPVGGLRKGIVRTKDFFERKIGNNFELSTMDFINIPENYLLEATNGKIFYDGYGEVTKIRQKLGYMTENARLKKIAGHLINMAQSGQYNYNRCLKHKEEGASQMAIFEFVKSAISVVFLLNKKYCPYYKWSFRAMLDLEKLSNLKDSFEFLITTDNSSQNAKTKIEVIEDIATLITNELRAQNITKMTCHDLEKNAYSVNDFITESDIRNLNIFIGIN